MNIILSSPNQDARTVAKNHYIFVLALVCPSNFSFIFIAEVELSWLFVHTSEFKAFNANNETMP